MAPATAFFVPDAPPGEHTDRAYEDRCGYAELTGGRPPRARRSFKLSCRCRGADCEMGVGAHDPSGGATVHAILWRGGHEIVTKRQSYPALEFD